MSSDSELDLVHACNDQKTLDYFSDIFVMIYVYFTNETKTTLNCVLICNIVYLLYSMVMILGEQENKQNLK